jgi:hypothetical protein
MAPPSTTAPVRFPELSTLELPVHALDGRATAVAVDVDLSAGTESAGISGDSST